MIRETILCCPSCESDNLHQKITDVYCRSKEDSDHGVHATITGGYEMLPSHEDGNPSCTIESCINPDTHVGSCPSSRRDGMSVEFLCEGCDAITVMSIYQQKGSTYIELSSVHDDEVRNHNLKENLNRLEY
jgi:hypothetical protein